jgi:serine/threonine protein kinase
LQEYLGHGGSGIVFRTEHRDLGSKLAIKIFYPLQPAYFQFHALLERGLQALSQIRHPNILSIREFGSASIEERSVSYALMDLVHGSNLNDWSRSIQEEPNVLKRRINVALQIAEGLHVSHNTTYTDEWGFEATSVLHGDIKPSNIFVETPDFAKIGDFMLIDFQRLLDPSVIPPTLLCRQGPSRIATTSAFGTPGFMAPEQERFGVVTPRTDIFSFGVTLGYLLSPDNPMYINDPTLDISSRFRRLISSMLSTDPSRRPRDMSEVVDCLRAESSAKMG